MVRYRSLPALQQDLVECRRCPRLVDWRQRVAEQKRAAFEDWQYWGRPVPGFGDPAARLLIVGLAPAAHGGNRTGRVFTGDRSGDWLFRALHRAGLANQALSRSPDDGLQLRDTYIVAIVRCAPPLNRPTVEERDNCRFWLEEEMARLERVKAVVCLGQMAYQQLLRVYAGWGVPVPKPRPPFAHLAEVDLGPEGPLVISSYHPSQQNTFTGVLTEEMFQAVFDRGAQAMAGSAGEGLH
ncbi:MAG: uracil-DNA glycosylase [Actinomycetota bacterium]|nr:uracil-DNA glycosylase [Actinomycetota bacterium]